VALALGLPPLGGGCGARSPSRDPHAIAGYGRPAGLPIGTGGSLGEREDPDATPPPEVTGADALAIPTLPLAEQPPPPAPCAGCVELSVHLNDINQHDDFAFDAGGANVIRVIWTLATNFNSDQLVVRPFVDGRRGSSIEVDANGFPLGKPVELVQEIAGTARWVGLALGSLDAWSVDQRVSIFVLRVRGEGPGGFDKVFRDEGHGLVPRTRQRQPRVTLQPAER
jgi:hypothetical protein